MNLDRLHTFRVVSETLNFRRAAEELGVTESAVSQQMKSLEREVGIPLFERIGRRVCLTPAGQVLVAESSRVFAAVDRARESLEQLSKSDRGRLRVGASTTPGIYLLPQVLGRFTVDLPLVQLEFRIGNSRHIEAMLLANELDLGVVGGRVSHEELFAVALGRDRIVVVGSPRLLGPVRSLSLADFGRWPLLAREPGSATRAAVEAAFLGAGVHLAPAFELPYPEALVRAAEAGLGVAFVCAHAAATGIEAGRLVEVRVEGLDIVRPFFAAYHRDKRVTSAMQELIDLLAAGLREFDLEAE
jgi:LysR family transcriptional regulator, low CO2-responsive transcriptional regulator